MDAMERDQQQIAETTRTLRRVFGLTQEALAAAANLSTRTIEKVESGRHHPQEQTLRSIARALGFDVAVFDHSPRTDPMHTRREVERAARKTAVLRTQPIRTASELLNEFGSWEAYLIDTSCISDEYALDVAAQMGDWIIDLIDCWDELRMSDRLESARDFIKLCRQIEERGYLCHMGHYRQQMRTTGKPTFLCVAGVMAIRPKADANGERYAVVKLQGDWETLEEDRPTLPET